ncbi:hypothetical protein OG911_28185 [Streptomyces sp. NBC_00208]|uniref:hypothetical protein n=1 Tax=Streptomyces sp. NBC_00208 TaxID=2975681 RepID=UPI002E286134|nr:hypothetical protein [Streptomyces sp. NBC_00208]
MNTAERLATLRALARDYQGELTTRVVQRRYAHRFGPGDWRAKARQDLAQLTGEGLLLLDETDPGRRCYRLNYAHGGQL